VYVERVELYLIYSSSIKSPACVVAGRLYLLGFFTLRNEIGLTRKGKLVEMHMHACPLVCVGLSVEESSQSSLIQPLPAGAHLLNLGESRLGLLAPTLAGLQS